MKRQAALSLVASIALGFAAPAALAKNAVKPAAAVASKAEVLKFKPERSAIEWHGKKVIGDSSHHGTVKLKSGTLNLVAGEPQSGEFVVDMTTITDKDLTDAEWNKKLVDHLNSDDFFSTAKHKDATLKIAKIEKVKGNTYKFTGSLVIKGVAKPLTFHGDLIRDKATASLKGDVVFDRTEYGVRYGSGKFFENLGDKMIADDVSLKVDLVADLT